MKTVSQLAILVVGLACCLAPAAAQLAPATAGQAAKKSAEKKAAPKKKTAGGKAEGAPDVTGMHATPYDCDLGNKVTIFKKANDDQQIALQWNKRTLQLMRIPTSTGAERFENANSGWVWIGIPAKGMLLDSKKGRQLANECRSEEQKKQLIQK